MGLDGRAGASLDGGRRSQAQEHRVKARGLAALKKPVGDSGGKFTGCRGPGVE